MKRKMQLHEYLEYLKTARNVRAPQEMFAAKLSAMSGLSIKQTHISRWANKHREPRLLMKRLIAAASDGVVAIDTWGTKRRPARSLARKLEEAVAA